MATLPFTAPKLKTPTAAPKPATPVSPFTPTAKAPTQPAQVTSPVQRVTSLPPDLKQIHDGLDHQGEIAGWNDHAFNDYLSMHKEGTNQVSLDGKTMTGIDAAKQTRDMLKPNKNKAKDKSKVPAPDPADEAIASRAAPTLTEA